MYLKCRLMIKIEDLNVWKLYKQIENIDKYK